LTDELLRRSLQDRHSGVRSHAIRLCEPRLGHSPKLGATLLSLADDDTPRVRLQLAYSLGEWNSENAGRALGDIAMRSSRDPYVTAAVLSSATHHTPRIAARLLDEISDFPAARHLLAKLLSMETVRGNWATVNSVVRGVAQLHEPGQPTDWQLEILGDWLDTVDRQNRTLAQLGEVSEDMKGTIAKLDGIIDAAEAMSIDDERTASSRARALRLLGRRNDADSDTLASLLTARAPVELQSAAVDAITRSCGEDVPRLLLAGWSQHGPSLRTAILNSLSTRVDWARSILEAIETGQLSVVELSAAHRQQLTTHQSESIRELANRWLATDSETDRTGVVEQYQDIADLAGDAASGRMVFEKHCSSCHRLAELGNAVAPDLSALGNRSTTALLTAIFDPNQAVETKYVSFVVSTVDGRVLTGLVESETASGVAFIDPQGKRRLILRSEIEEMRCTNQSLMPEGLERDLDHQSVADLLAFLGANGQPRKEFPGNEPQLVQPEALRGDLYLLATNCSIFGASLIYEPHFRNLGYWSSETDHAVWNFEVREPGVYSVSCDWACDDSTAGNGYVLELGQHRLTGHVSGTGTWEEYHLQEIAKVQLESGPSSAVFRSDGPVSDWLIDLRGIRLHRIDPQP